MVYLRMMPLGLAGGSQETTTLLAEDGTALMPAGGPGTEGAKLGPQEGPRGPLQPPCLPDDAAGPGSGPPLHGWLWPPAHVKAVGLIAARV